LFCIFIVPTLPSLPSAHSHGGIFTRFRRISSRPLPSLVCVGTALDLVLVHRFQRFGDSYHQRDQFLLGKSGVIDQIRIDRILEIPPLIVWKEDVDGFGTRITSIRSELRTGFSHNGMIDGWDDISVWAEESICFHLFQRL
jgi:hypothetical protein